MGQEYGEKLLMKFRSAEDIIRFVETCEKYDDAIDVMVGKISTDAKSILGMLRMKPGEQVLIDYQCYDNEDNYQEFRADIMKKFEVEAVPDRRQP